MANDDVLRVLSMYAPAERWTATGFGYAHLVWSVRIEAGTAWVRRDLPGYAHVLVTGHVDDIDALMTRAERMAQADAMEVGDGAE